MRLRPGWTTGSPASSSPQVAESPRVIVRANVADRAVAEAKKIGHDLKRAGTAIRHSPKTVQEAQQVIAVLAKAHEQNGVLSAEHKKTWQSALEVLEDAHMVAAQEAQSEAVRIHGTTGHSPSMKSSMAPTNAIQQMETDPVRAAKEAVERMEARRLKLLDGKPTMEQAQALALERRRKAEERRKGRGDA